MLSLFLGSDGLMIEAIHSERKGRCMCQHVYHGCSVSTEKAKTKVEIAIFCKPSLYHQRSPDHTRHWDIQKSSNSRSCPKQGDDSGKIC